MGLPTWEASGMGLTGRMEVREQIRTLLPASYQRLRKKTTCFCKYDTLLTLLLPKIPLRWDDNAQPLSCASAVIEDDKCDE